MFLVVFGIKFYRQKRSILIWGAPENVHLTALGCIAVLNVDVPWEEGFGGSNVILSGRRV